VHSSPAGSESGQWYLRSAPDCWNQRRRNLKMPGCRLPPPLLLHHSGHTDFAADTTAAWSPVDRVYCRALLCNSTAGSALAIPSTGRSARSGLEILSSLSVPAPTHHSARTLSSVYPWSYYITSGSIAPTFLCGIALIVNQLHLDEVKNL